MKIGDKYICIKTKTYNNHILYINTEYTIEKIYYREKMVRVISNKNMWMIDGVDYNFNWGFALEESKLWSKFGEHFITKKDIITTQFIILDPKEQRKLKIEKINENW